MVAWRIVLPPTWTGTRYVTAFGSGIVASISVSTITYELANLHGDVVAVTADTSGLGIGTYAETGEYGTAVGISSTGSYGFRGTTQRSTQSMNGLIQTGVRTYNPTTGSFLSIDQILGGNSTRYDYPANPVGENDDSGLTHNVNGHSCHWRGCDFRLNNKKAKHIADLLRTASSIAGVAVAVLDIAGSPELVPVIALLVPILALAAQIITDLVDKYHSGIFIRVYWSGEGYIKQQ